MATCSARRQDGQPCRARAITGAAVCRVHGGRAPQVRTAAAARAAEQRAMRELRRRGYDPVTDPLRKLQEVAGETEALKTLFSEAAGRLREDEWRYKHPHAGEQVRGERQLYTRYLLQLGELLVKINKLDVDDRIYRITEAQATHVAAVVERALQRLPLPADSLTDAREFIVSELRRGQNGTTDRARAVVATVVDGPS